MKGRQRSPPKHQMTDQTGSAHGIFSKIHVWAYFSKISGLGYMSDRSTSTSMSERKREKALDSLTTSVQDGKQWNQNRAYFLRTGTVRAIPHIYIHTTFSENAREEGKFASG